MAVLSFSDWARVFAFACKKDPKLVTEIQTLRGLLKTDLLKAAIWFHDNLPDLYESAPGVPGTPGVDFEPFPDPDPNDPVGNPNPVCLIDLDQIVYTGAKDFKLMDKTALERIISGTDIVELEKNYWEFRGKVIS